MDVPGYWPGDTLVETPGTRVEFPNSRKLRRERIATAFGQGLLAGDVIPDDTYRWIDAPEKFAHHAVTLADALIEALGEDFEE